MEFCSTRDRSLRVSAAQAIYQGIAPDGGLFVPRQFPQLSEEQLDAMCQMGYHERAVEVLSGFLTDFSREELYRCVTAAYTAEKFGGASPTRLARLGEQAYLLELWHGPTCAFKDMALQLLPHLLRTSAQKVADGKDLVILVATSGDTGKAALEGFCDAEGTEIMVFYPRDGVSLMQKLQMTTQEGKNVSVCAIEGNFDDAQTAVKQIFTDRQVGARLAAAGKAFSSANSINFGRLVPQVVYYVSAYCDLVQDEQIAMGQLVDVVVPTGNFGNILAAYYAKRMGVPLGRFICASNRNRVLTDFIETGVYDRRREFFATTSPSMDILISSNLERLLYHLYGEDDVAVATLMQQLAQEGRYEIDAQVLQQLQQEFFAGSCDEHETADTIRGLFGSYSYVCDPHTAVAVEVWERYVRETGSTAPALIASTASPYKFPHSVLGALDASAVSADEFADIEKLHTLTGSPVPTQIAALAQKRVRFGESCARDRVLEFVLGQLGC